MNKLKKSIDNRIESILYFLQNDHHLNPASPAAQLHLLSTEPNNMEKNVQLSIATNSSEETNGSNFKSILTHSNEFLTKEKQSFKIENELFMHQHHDHLGEVIEECCETSHNESIIPINLWSHENGLKNDVNSSISRFKDKPYQDQYEERRPLFERNSQVLSEFSEVNFLKMKSWSASKKHYRNSSYERTAKEYSTPKSGHRRSHPYSFCISGGKQFHDIFSSNIRKVKTIRLETLEKIKQQISEAEKKTRKETKENNVRTKMLTRVIKSTFKNEEFMMTM